MLYIQLLETPLPIYFTNFQLSYQQVHGSWISIAKYQEREKNNALMCIYNLILSSSHLPHPSPFLLSAPAPPADVFPSSSSQCNRSTLVLARYALANLHASISAKFHASIAPLTFFSSLVNFLFKPNSFAFLNKSCSFRKSSSDGMGPSFRSCSGFGRRSGPGTGVSDFPSSKVALMGMVKPKYQSRSEWTGFSAVSQRECVFPYGEATASLNLITRGAEETPVPSSSFVR